MDHPEFNNVSRTQDLNHFNEDEIVPRGRRKAGRGRPDQKFEEIEKEDVESEEESEEMDVILEEKVEHEFIDGIYVPPEPGKRTFNENDIRGECETDRNGNLQLICNDKGHWIDLRGRRVNEKGYLINDRGDVIDRRSGKPMFRQSDLDDSGEVPGHHALERFNFNPNDVRGDMERDMNGNIVLLRNSNGQLVDKHGRPINEQGFLIDERGNIIDKYGRIKIEKKYLSPDGGLPRCLNMDGRKFDLYSVVGEFDTDRNGNPVFLTDE